MKDLTPWAFPFQIFGLQFKQKWWTINLWEGELRDVQIGD
jgi:hypothetical protein